MRVGVVESVAPDYFTDNVGLATLAIWLFAAALTFRSRHST